MRPNVFNSSFEYSESDPEGYHGGEARVGKQAGGKALTVRLYELPVAQSLCPYHYEYEEEWLLILDGAPTLRTPAGEEQLTRGDLVCFPPGPDGAHKLTSNERDATRLLMWSSSREPAVAVYPDSDKIGVWPGNDADNVMLHRSSGNVDYYQGET
jgi:uncharacterized cupin superfamily protein